MPSKKKKYNARFPAGRIKKIMQTDEEIGKVAQAVPVIISRTLEMFVESLLTKAMQITSARNAKTLTPSHMKQCILSENRFDFLKDLVKSIPDVSSVEDDPSTPIGNLSPGSSKSYSTFSGFSFDRKHSDTNSSRSAVSQNSIEEDFNSTPTPSTLYPKFYNEIPIGNQDSPSPKPEEKSNPTIIRMPVIQHTSGSNSNNNKHLVQTNKSSASLHTPKPPPPPVQSVHSSSEEDDDEEEEEEEEVECIENGVQVKQMLLSNCLKAQNSNIDEDYDT